MGNVDWLVRTVAHFGFHWGTGDICTMVENNRVEIGVSYRCETKANCHHVGVCGNSGWMEKTPVQSEGGYARFKKNVPYYAVSTGFFFCELFFLLPQILEGRKNSMELSFFFFGPTPTPSYCETGLSVGVTLLILPSRPKRMLGLGSLGDDGRRTIFSKIFLLLTVATGMHLFLTADATSLREQFANDVGAVWLTFAVPWNPICQSFCDGIVTTPFPVFLEAPKVRWSPDKFGGDSRFAT